MGCYSRKLKRGLKWRFAGSHYGEKYCSKAIYPTKKEAEKAERAEIERIEKEQIRPTRKMGLKELMNKRLDYIQTYQSGHYYKENRRYFKLMLSEWGEIDATEVSKEMIHGLIIKEAKRLKTRGKSNYKANSLLRSVKSLLNWGNSIYDLEIPKLNIQFLPIDIRLKYIPPDKDVEAVKKECTDNQRLLIDFVDETAARINEAVSLTWEDVDGNLLTLYTRKSKNSNRVPRRIPMPECLKGLAGKGKVFTEWNAYPRFLEDKVLKLNQRRWAWHSLRHRRASKWANSGMIIVEIQYRLGHSNLSVTQKYCQLLGFRNM
jgi:integrase